MPSGQRLRGRRRRRTQRLSGGHLAEAVGFLFGQLEIDPDMVDLKELFAKHSHMDETSST